MPSIQLMLADMKHLAWLVGRTEMFCRVSTISHYCTKPVTLQTWSKLWAVQTNVPTLIQPYKMMKYTTMSTDVCWQPNLSLFSHFHKQAFKEGTKLPPCLYSAWHYSIAVPKDEHGLTYEFICMRVADEIALYGYCSMVWGTPRLGWKRAPEWPAIAMALACPEGFELIYGCRAADAARLAVRKDDEMFDLMRTFCPFP